MARFETVQNRSEVVIEAESNVHPIRVATNRIDGYFEAVFDNDGQIDLSTSPSGQLEITVEDLKSGNALLDKVMPAHLDTRRYPTIRAAIVELHANDRNHYHAVGDITFHGVTKRLEDTLTIRWLDKVTLGIRGKTIIDVLDFKVAPPQLLVLKVESQINVMLNFVVQQVE